jgi:tetratricopeptide (TPR) repeat protein
MYILKTILTFLIINCFSTFAYSQSSVQEAFNTSYSLEYYGEYAKAADAIKKVYDEKSYEINMRAGWLHYLAGLYIESQGYYKRAIALKPTSIEARMGYIYPVAALGNMNLVTDQYLKIIEVDPTNTTANYRMGMIAFEKKDYKKAREYFEKVTNLYPYSYDSVIMLAWTHYYLKQNKEAKELFQTVLLLYPDNVSAKEGLGLIK